MESAADSRVDSGGPVFGPFRPGRLPGPASSLLPLLETAKMAVIKVATHLRNARKLAYGWRGWKSHAKE